MGSSCSTYKNKQKLLKRKIIHFEEIKMNQIIKTDEINLEFQQNNFNTDVDQQIKLIKLMKQFQQFHKESFNFLQVKFESKVLIDKIGDTLLQNFDEKIQFKELISVDLTDSKEQINCKTIKSKQEVSIEVKFPLKQEKNDLTSNQYGQEVPQLVKFKKLDQSFDKFSNYEIFAPYESSQIVLQNQQHFKKNSVNKTNDSNILSNGELQIVNKNLYLKNQVSSILNDCSQEQASIQTKFQNDISQIENIHLIENQFEKFNDTNIFNDCSQNQLRKQVQQIETEKIINDQNLSEKYLHTNISKDNPQKKKQIQFQNETKKVDNDLKLFQTKNNANNSNDFQQKKETQQIQLISVCPQIQNIQKSIEKTCNTNIINGYSFKQTIQLQNGNSKVEKINNDQNSNRTSFQKEENKLKEQFSHTYPNDKPNDNNDTKQRYQKSILKPINKLQAKKNLIFDSPDLQHDLEEQEIFKSFKKIPSVKQVKFLNILSQIKNQKDNQINYIKKYQNYVKRNYPENQNNGFPFQINQKLKNQQLNKHNSQEDSQKSLSINIYDSSENKVIQNKSINQTQIDNQLSIDLQSQNEKICQDSQSDKILKKNNSKQKFQIKTGLNDKEQIGMKPSGQQIQPYVDNFFQTTSKSDNKSFNSNCNLKQQNNELITFNQFESQEKSLTENLKISNRSFKSASNKNIIGWNQFLSYKSSSNESIIPNILINNSLQLDLSQAKNDNLHQNFQQEINNSIRNPNDQQKKTLLNQTLSINKSIESNQIYENIKNISQKNIRFKLNKQKYDSFRTFQYQPNTYYQTNLKFLLHNDFPHQSKKLINTPLNYI